MMRTLTCLKCKDKWTELGKKPTKGPDGKVMEINGICPRCSYAEKGEKPG